MGKTDDSQYGVVLDAGSSGTRIYVYRWLKNSKSRQSNDPVLLKSLPVLETKDKWTKKVHPGVSTFGDKPELVGPDHLKELLDHALQYIPKTAVKDTPIFLLATAGVRLLPDHQRSTLLSNICSYMQSTTQFLLPDCDLHVQVIPGETEGLYGWIAANYLIGGFDAPGQHDHGKGHHTYGFLDMGGASAQIAFAPNATEAEKHANDLKLVRFRNVDGSIQEYQVFVTTWLGFGVNEARKRYVKALVESLDSSDVFEMPDPCLPKGLLMTLDGKIMPATSASKQSEQHLIGTGLFDECMKRTYPLLEKDVVCEDDPCLIGGVHVPAIDFDVNHFIGVSEYWHTTHQIFEMGHRDKSYDFNTYQDRVHEFCQQDWSTIEAGIEDHLWGNKVDAQTAYEVCFKASWLINMLHEGIGIPRIGLEKSPNSQGQNKENAEAENGYLDAFQAVNKIKSSEVSWTLGKMVLYASADIQNVSVDDLPVGFGSNTPDVPVPADFQYPGGGRLQGISDDASGSESGSQSLTDKFSSSIFKSDASHRVPGFIFFLLIIVIAMFYLCGRERRSRVYKYLFRSFSSGRSSKASSSKVSSFMHSILGRRSASLEYDRALEDGAATRLYDPADFELGDLNESDEDLTIPKTVNGRTLPTISSKRPVLNSAKSALSHLGPAAGRLSPEVMDRRGLVIRTESRDNLGDIGGRKSRSGSLSPTRLRDARIP